LRIRPLLLNSSTIRATRSIDITTPIATRIVPEEVILVKYIKKFDDSCIKIDEIIELVIFIVALRTDYPVMWAAVK